MPDVSLLQREYYGGGEEESKTPGIVFAVASILLLLSVVAFGGLYFYNRSLVSRAQATAESIKGLHIGDIAETISQLKEVGSKAQGLENLRITHTDISGLLASVEKTTHPKTIFSNATLDARKNNVQLKGIAETTKVVARQVEIYQQEAKLSDFSVENVRYEGGVKMVGFEASMTFVDQ